MCVYVCMYTYVYIYICVYVYAYIYIYISILLLWRVKPGLLPAPKLSLSDVLEVVWPRHVAPWPTPVTHYVGFWCRIGNGCPRLNFSLSFFSDNKAMNLQDF